METADTPGHVYLGGKLGFIYGSISFLAIIFGFLFIPETKRMELEDIDKQFSVPSKDDLKIAENQAYEEETTISEVPK
ncbi:general substrate transporter [Penicillium atrosanguineum]|nr:general substrate transporter [Penicillium atrosanguineum]